MILVDILGKIKEIGENKMKKTTTTTTTTVVTEEVNAVHIVCILDRSGSMGHLAPEVIGSFNNFVNEQKAEEGKAYLTLVLFDDQYDVVYDRIDIQEVPELTSKLYYARGMTAMNDAIGKAINACTDKDVMVLIQTDGMENMSREYKNADIKKLVSEKEALGWDFTFLGANIDTMAEGNSRGFAASKSFSFDASVQGVQTAYNSMDASTKAYRSMKSAEWDGSTLASEATDIK